MAVDGLNLMHSHDAYPGIFTELNPYDNPVTTLLAQKGFRIEKQKNYTYTTHSNSEASAANLKPDNASPTYGSSTFANGSNTVQVFFEGAQTTWARMGDQDLGRVLGYQGPSNPSIEPDPQDRAEAEALGTIKSQLEYIAREGVLELNSSEGTTTAWQQRGYRYAPGIVNVIPPDAALGTGTPGTGGTYGTLTLTSVTDALQSAWESRLWDGGKPLTCVTNATGKRQLTDIFVSAFNFGKNGLEREEAGVALQRFTTDFGNVDIVLTHNMPSKDMYFLNLDVMSLVARPVPGKGFMFKEDFDNNDKAAKSSGIYAEIGVDHGVGSAHIRMTGVGSTVVGGQVVLAT